MINGKRQNNSLKNECLNIYFPRRDTNNEHIYEKLLNITNHQANTKSKHLTPFRTTLLKKKIPPKQKRTCVGKDIEQMVQLVWKTSEAL